VTPPPPVVVAPTVVDAGPQPPPAPEALDELSGLPTIKKPKVVVAKAPKAPECHYDDAFANAARQTLAQLGRGVSRVKQDQLEDLGDELHTAFQARDCRAVEAVVKKMKAVVAAP